MDDYDKSMGASFLRIHNEHNSIYRKAFKGRLAYEIFFQCKQQFQRANLKLGRTPERVKFPLHT